MTNAAQITHIYTHKIVTCTIFNNKIITFLSGLKYLCNNFLNLKLQKFVNFW